MKIGLLSSGPEMLPLMQFLSKYDHEYHIFWDWQFRPWGDKSSELVNNRCIFGLKYLEGLGVEKVIVPPLYEQTYVSENMLPLFKTYLYQYCLKYSLVGKLGVLCDPHHLESVESFLKNLTTTYILSETQQSTKGFHQDFPLWKKEVRMRNYYLTTYGRRDWMVRKTLKTDLRYFQDAGVDTLIPMSRGYLFYQKMIKQRTNRKRLRFHGLDAVQSCREQLSNEYDVQSSDYRVIVHTSDVDGGPVLSEKKWTSLMSRGDASSVEIIPINDRY